MDRVAFIARVSLVSLVIAGCAPPSMNGPFGSPVQSALLAPYAGRWVFNIEKTLAATGSSDEEIAKSRRNYAANALVTQLYPDLSIRGNEAVGAGLVSSEYRFFAMHRHGSKLCGKAWHHEDRSDPGDMSKCYVRLSLQKGDLYLEVNMLEEIPDDDPDLSAKPVEADSAKCEADKPDPKEWETLVFKRGS